MEEIQKSGTKEKVYYHLILDQSGSMQDCKDATISGFNEQLQTIKSIANEFPDKEILFSLTTFNNKIHYLFDRKQPADIPVLTDSNYKPENSTALFDAIGETAIWLNREVLQELNDDIASVYIVVITDGLENVSKYFNLKTISRLIKDLEKTGNWTFTFFGDSKEVMSQAEEMNIKDENTFMYFRGDMGETMNRSSQIFRERLEIPRIKRKK